MLFISKKQLISTNENLVWCLSASCFKAGCKLVSLSRMAFPRSCSCQGDCGIHYACALLGRNLAQQNT